MSSNIDSSTINSISSQVSIANTIATNALNEIQNINSNTIINTSNIEILENKLKALVNLLESSGTISTSYNDL
jgi:hypothetical protein